MLLAYTHGAAAHAVQDTRLRRKTPYKWSCATFMDLPSILSKSFRAILTHNFGQFEQKHMYMKNNGESYFLRKILCS
jgi:hypothetical protein